MTKPKNDDMISIILVDDIAETRETIKKMLAFEQDFKVVGSANNGRDGVEMAKELKPDIVLMDINMPDMDGLEAASRITKVVPTVGVIMMSVQDDPDYMQRAMLAGARFFLPKPVDMDQLYNTIRSVYAQYTPIREQMRRMQEAQAYVPIREEEESKRAVGDRAGHIIAVYSPQGGAGTTTIATSLASGLMKEGTRVLLVDCDLEFGDVGIVLALKAQSTLAEITENADDIDIEYFDSIVATHDSGMKVLLAPTRPAFGHEIRDLRPESVATVISQVRGHYDFIVLDLATSIDGVSASLLELANKIVVITLPTLTSIKNVRVVLDLFDQTEFPPEKTMLIINKAIENPNKNQRAIVPPEKIQAFLKRPVEGLIPQVDEMFILSAFQRGVPVIASDRDVNKAPIKQLIQLSDHLYSSLMGVDEFLDDSGAPEDSGGGIFSFGRRKR